MVHHLIIKNLVKKKKILKKIKENSNKLIYNKYKKENKQLNQISNDKLKEEIRSYENQLKGSNILLQVQENSKICNKCVIC